MANVTKYWSYKAAWEKLHAAYEGGFYLEVVTICESLISDRLLSYVLGKSPSTNFGTRTPFNRVIQKWIDLSRGTLPLIEGIDLGQAVDGWRNVRNEVVHAIAKSMPGTATMKISDFEAKAAKCAETGIKLARKVSDWHKSQLRAVKKQQQINDVTG